MAVGASYHDNPSENNNGTVRVYQWDGSSWNRLGTEGDLDGEAGDEAGFSVALSSDGTIVAVGSPYHDNPSENNNGTVRVYQLNGSSWNRLGTEGDLDGQTGDYAGFSVALSSDGTILSVGAQGHDNDRNCSSISIEWF